MSTADDQIPADPGLEPTMTLEGCRELADELALIHYNRSVEAGAPRRYEGFVMSNGPHIVTRVYRDGVFIDEAEWERPR